MNYSTMMPRFKRFVAEYIREELLSGADKEIFKDDDVYVVWFSKTLRNAKALLSTDLPDGRYYEVTYNGERNEYYFDCYKKEINKLILGDERDE